MGEGQFLTPDNPSGGIAGTLSRLTIGQHLPGVPEPRRQTRWSILSSRAVE